MRILVVEDEPGIAGFVRRGLHFEGYDVAVVPDGPTALRALRDSPPDLLVLDVMVPGVDGLEIARRLRAACGVGRRGGERDAESVSVMEPH